MASSAFLLLPAGLLHGLTMLAMVVLLPAAEGAAGAGGRGGLRLRGLLRQSAAMAMVAAALAYVYCLIRTILVWLFVLLAGAQTPAAGALVGGLVGLVLFVLPQEIGPERRARAPLERANAALAELVPVIVIGALIAALR